MTTAEQTMSRIGSTVAIVIPIIFVQVSLWWAPVSAQRQQALDSGCQQCQQGPDACKQIAGLYTVALLTKGSFNPIVDIPPRACYINITELAPSQNHLAVRTEEGDSIVNGYWTAGGTGSFRGVGTVFQHNKGARNCPGECITAPGPTNRRITVQLLYNDKNPGIAYSFVLPKDVPFELFKSSAPGLQATSAAGPGRAPVPPTGNSLDELAPEPYTGAARPNTLTSQLQEPRGPRPSRGQRTSADPSSERDGAERPPAAGSSYVGSSYGSHTLGGRGQSYTLQTSDIEQDVPSVSNRRRYSGSRGSNYSRRFLRRRQQRPSRNKQPQTPPYSATHNKDRSRGFQTSASSSRGGPEDRAYSRGVEADNRLQGIERPLEQRPALNIGQGGGQNRYEWVIAGLNQCSATCGGGTQEAQLICVVSGTGSQVVVTSDNCQNAIRPSVQRVSCNNEPCPPGWVAEQWTECSASCGGGTQTRRVECRQRFSANLDISVSSSQCQQSLKPSASQQCNVDSCSGWTPGDWGECSATCGGGERTRTAQCLDEQGDKIPEAYCPASDKPAVTEQCNTRPCETQWWHTLWSDQCSGSCGSGVTSRQVMCADRTGRAVEDSACVSDQRPADTEQCEARLSCGTSWFTGPWAQCSTTCGKGVRTRQVICVRMGEEQEAAGGEVVAVGEDQCLEDTKPSEEEECSQPACSGLYYVTNWSQCSVTCGSGVRTREIRCLDENQQPSRSCDSARAPLAGEACQLSPCPSLSQDVRSRPSQGRLSDTLENADDERTGYNTPNNNNNNNNYYSRYRNYNTANNVNEGRRGKHRHGGHSSRSRHSGQNCRDSYWNCRIVVQARMCYYSYYREGCCASCRKASKDH